MNIRIITLVIIFLVAIISQLSIDNYLPSLPYLTQLFHAEAATLRLTVIIFMFGAGISSFFFGILSDNIGRKKSLLITLSIFLFGNLICLLAVNSFMLMLGRLLQGLGAGGCLALNRVMLFDISNDRNELAHIGSYLSTVISIVPTLSPTLGAFLFTQLGWRSNFILLFFSTLLAILLSWKYLSETKKVELLTESRNDLITDIKYILRDSSFIGFLICAALITTAALALMSVGPHLFQTALHLTPMQYGYVTFFIGLAMILGSLGNALLVKHLGLHKTINSGVIIIFLSSMVMLFLYFTGYFNFLVIMIPAMIYLFGGDFISTNAYAGGMTNIKSQAGTATALYISLQLLFAAVIGFVVAYLPDNNQFPIGLIFLSIAIVIFIILKMFLKNAEI